MKLFLSLGRKFAGNWRRGLGGLVLAAALCPTASALTTWTLASSNSLLTRSFAIDSNGALYTGTVSNGVLRSTDASNWTSINSGMTYTEVRALLADSTTVYAGGLSSTTAGGVSRYTFTANNWSTTSGLAIPVNKLARDNKGMLYAATNNGMYRSANGSTWSSINLSIPNGSVMLGLAVDSAGTVYACGSTGMIKSLDQGSSWGTVLAPFSAAGVQVVAVDSAKVVYVGHSTQGVYKSSDGGATWTAINTGLTPTNGSYASVNTLTFDRYGTAFIGTSAGAYVYVSGSWIAINTGFANSASQVVNALVFDSADNLYAATTAGVYKSTNASTAPPAVTTPNPFSFAAKTDVALSAVVESAAITVSGINSAAPISISGGEYAISGGSYTSSAGTVLNGQTVTVRVTSSSAFGTASSAVLTIGGVTGSFSATTMSFTPVTSVTQVFTSTDAAVTVSPTGIVTFSGATASPLVLTASAPNDALLQLPSVKIQATALNSTLSYEDKTPAKQGFAAADPAQLQIKQVVQQGATQPAMEVARGTVSVAATSSDARIPLRLPTATRGALLRTLGAAKVDINRDSARNTLAYVSEGKLALQIASGNGFSAAGEVNVYGGETVQIGNDGSLTQIRIGSLTGTQTQVGDRLSLTGVASTAKVTNLSGKLPRFNDKTLDSLVSEAIAKLYGVTAGASSYDSATGVLSVTINGVVRRYVVMGDVRIDTNAASNLFAATPANGAYELSYNGLIFSVASAVGYLNELTTAVTALDSAASLSLLNGGAIKATIKGVVYAVAPGNAVTAMAAASSIPGFETDSSGYPLFRDKTGAKQLLFPVLLDAASVQTIFAAADAGFAVNNDGNGTTTVTYLGKTYTVVPDYIVINAPPARANDLFWLDGGKVYVRYPDGTAQGVTVK